jgi:hypothetical protein
MQKESPNDGAEWQLASNEQAAVLTSVKGKNISSHRLLLYGKEGERVGMGPPNQHRASASSRTGERAACWVPLSRVTDRWARSQYLKVARAKPVSGRIVSSPTR